MKYLTRDEKVINIGYEREVNYDCKERKQMHVISLVNIKGGVGKTVSAVNIATVLAGYNYKVLLIDLDAQANTTQHFNMYDPEQLSSYDVLMDKNIRLQEVIQPTSIENLDLIPSNIKLILAENEIITDTRKSRENRLQRALKDANYDYVIIDCPPSLGMITTNALVASNYVLTPIKIDRFALDGFSYLLSTIDEIRDEFNPKLEFLGAFITMDKRTTVNREVKEMLQKNLGKKLLNTSIRENTTLVQSTFEQIPVTIYDPKANSAIDYQELTKEVIANV